MKRTIIIIMVLMLAGTTAVFAQDTAIASESETVTLFEKAIVPVTFNKEYTKQEIAEIIHPEGNFDKAGEWAVNMPREQGLVLKKRITGKSTTFDESDSQYCLGIKWIPFCRGFNWVEIRPPQPLRIPGQAKAISILVNGRNFRHKLYAWVRDWTGAEYRIELGQLNFKGWQQLAVKIPPYVKQYSRYVPEYRSVYLTKFVVEFAPDEYPVETYLYLDNFMCAVDTYVPDWDGSDFIDEYGVERFETEQWEGSKLPSNTGTGTSE